MPGLLVGPHLQLGGLAAERGRVVDDDVGYVFSSALVAGGLGGYAGAGLVLGQAALLG